MLGLRELEKLNFLIFKTCIAKEQSRILKYIFWSRAKNSTSKPSFIKISNDKDENIFHF